MRPSRLIALALLPAAVAGCGTVGSTLGVGNEYEIVSASPAAISIRYRGDDESLAAGRARDHCAQYGTSPVLRTVTPGEGWRTAVYDCVRA